MFQSQSHCLYEETNHYSKQVSERIDSLKNNCAPGSDGVTREYLNYGKSDTLFEVLASLVSCILSAQIVSRNFYIRIITPILKTPSPCETVN